MPVCKNLITGCLFGASFFMACQHVPEKEPAASIPPDHAPAMYETSELAQLMRDMYDQNMAFRTMILQDSVPRQFPARFNRIHTAAISKGMDRGKGPFDAMASQYLESVKAITEAPSPAEAKVAYNNMVMSCAGCHQVYCQGPLPKIRRMKIKAL